MAELTSTPDPAAPYRGMICRYSFGLPDLAGGLRYLRVPHNTADDE